MVLWISAIISVASQISANPALNSFCLWLSELSPSFSQKVLNPTPLNPAPATCHKRKRKLRCSFRNAALQKLHCNIGFFCSAEVIWTKSCAAANEKLHCNIEKLRCRKVALSCRFPAGFKPPRLGTHVSDLLIYRFRERRPAGKR